MQAVKTKIYDYLGVSEAIVNSSYDENQWAAFYESVIEPLALQLMPTTLEECIRRIQSDESRAHNRKLNEKLAAEWFEKYDASRRSDEIPPTKIF